MQVALTGNYRSAYSPLNAIRTIGATWRSFIHAWIGSIAVSAAAIASGPLAPWGLFYSYLVILHLFIQALVVHKIRGARERFHRSLPLFGQQ